MTAEMSTAVRHGLSLERRRRLTDLYGPLRRWSCELDLPAGPATVWIAIEGPAPQALMHVELALPDRILFELGTTMEGRGTPLPAGDMLLAIALYSGRTGLGFEQRLDDGPPMRGQLALWLDASSSTGSVSAQVDRMA